MARHPSRTEPTGMQVLMSRVGRRERPDWFDHSTKTVLDRSGELLAARGPAELEQRTAEFLGAELPASRTAGVRHRRSAGPASRPAPPALS